jgi:hypothetical protein
MVQQYDAGPTVLATLQPEELARLCPYWSATRKQNVWGQGGELVTARVSRGWVLCPRWAALLNEVRKMHEVLA